MSGKEEIRAEVHRSVFCIAIGKLSIQIGWRSAHDELKERLTGNLHAVVDELTQEAVSARDLLRAIRIGALQQVNGTIQRRGRIVDQLIAWVFIAIALLMVVLIGHQTWDARGLAQQFMGIGFIGALVASVLLLCAKVLYPQLVAARVERFLERRYQQ